MCGGCPDEEGTMRHDPAFARWTGIWPGSAESEALGLYSKMTPDGWKKCDKNDPDGHADLNTFHSEGYYKIFFIKPTKENGREI